MSPPAEGAVASQAVDGGEVVGLEPKPAIVEPGDRSVDDARRIEAIHSSAPRLLDARRLIIEPRLIGGNLARLRGANLATKDLQPLPPEPGELVVVPHRHERPARPRPL